MNRSTRRRRNALLSVRVGYATPGKRESLDPHGPWSCGFTCHILPLTRLATCRFVQLMVVRAFCVSVSDLLAARRCRAHVACARQVAMYLTHITCQFSMTEVGRCYGRDRTTAAHACRCVEDRRDDPRFDMSLYALESVIQTWIKRQIIIHNILSHCN